MFELTLPAMTCGHCVQAVTRTVQQLDPAATLAFDLSAQRVRIETTRAPADVAAALADEGYPARPAA